MQIFQLKLDFLKSKSFISWKLYYSILGAILNMFENDQEIYESILKISFFFDKEHFYVIVSIAWKESFSKAVSYLLDKNHNFIVIDKHRFLYEKIDFNLKVLDFEKLRLNKVKKFTLKFLSPTQLRNQNKMFILPEPGRFLFSVYEKVKKLWLNFNIDEKDFKKWLWYSVLASRFDLKSELVEIKWSKRAGVIWNISYVVYDENETYQKILSLILQSIPYTWIGSWTRLGLWNVKVLDCK